MSSQTIDYATPSSRQKIFALLTSKSTRRTLTYVGLAAILYIASYIGLSVCGRFEPAVFGAYSVKEYAWLPAGFGKDHGHRSGLHYAFLPLYVADRAHDLVPSEGRDVPDSVMPGA